jgi:glucose/arabinose dehydrogenase
MRPLPVLLLATVLLALPRAALAQLQLTPVATSLHSPLFVGPAGDGTKRLFIVEQGGIIDVLQPGDSKPAVFLDLHTKTSINGERGLLGLAFHPHYLVNGRFFVYYVRTADGTIVVAEYKVSKNPNVADTAETVLLTVAHSANSNHNGGMLAFGPDGYLYVGVGDGGSGNDPPNNAQNVNVHLGKILRIDVDPPAGSGVAYQSPVSNPFYASIPGLDEIFAFGLRNPWRFSFDRSTGQMWLADVGQGSREEVDTPIVNGGNYGWRVFEGFACTGNDSSLCNPANYRPPVFEYAHTNGRCSITGGYVYRGSRGTLPAGTYVYGDYCTGEIFGWDGAASRLLVDTPMSISSFGQDEDGELYVVDLSGSVSRIGPPITCTYVLSIVDRRVGPAGGPGALRVSVEDGCAWSVVKDASWLHIRAGARGIGAGTIGFQVDANTTGQTRVGAIRIAGLAFTVTQDAGGIMAEPAPPQELSWDQRVSSLVCSSCRWPAPWPRSSPSFAPASITSSSTSSSRTRTTKPFAI